MPIARWPTAPPCPVAFQQDARHLAAVQQHVVRPFQREALRQAGQRHEGIAQRQCRGEGAQRRPSAGGPSGCSTSVAAKLPARAGPGAAAPARAPRSARRARIQVGPARPRRRAAASALVLSTVVAGRGAPRPRARSRSADKRLRRRQRPRASIPKRLTMPSTMTSADAHQHRPLHRRPCGCRAASRLGAEIHEVDDAQIVEGADHRGDHARHRQPDHARHRPPPSARRTCRRSPTIGGTPARLNISTSIASAFSGSRLGDTGSGWRCRSPGGRPLHRQDEGEGADVHRHIDRHVDQHRLHALRRARRQARSAQSPCGRSRNRPSAA